MDLLESSPRCSRIFWTVSYPASKAPRTLFAFSSLTTLRARLAARRSSRAAFALSFATRSAFHLAISASFARCLTKAFARSAAWMSSHAFSFSAFSLLVHFERSRILGISNSSKSLRSSFVRGFRWFGRWVLTILNLIFFFFFFIYLLLIGLSHQCKKNHFLQTEAYLALRFDLGLAFENRRLLSRRDGFVSPAISSASFKVLNLWICFASWIGLLFSSRGTIWYFTAPSPSFP